MLLKDILLGNEPLLFFFSQIFIAVVSSKEKTVLLVSDALFN